VWKLGRYHFRVWKWKESPLLLNELMTCTTFMWLYSNFFKRVWWLWCWLTVGLFCMFQVSSCHVIVSDSMESSVRLSPCEQDQDEEEEVGSGVQSRVMCTVVSGGSDNAAPFFLLHCIPMLLLLLAAALLLLPLPHRRHNRTLRSIHRDSGIIAPKALGRVSSNGAFNRSSTTDTLLERKLTQGFQFWIPSC
jgi:hypothetical protein